MEQRILKKLLEYVEEDIPFGDITSELIPQGTRCKARIEARENFKVFGLEYAKGLCEHYGINVKLKKNDGDWVVKDEVLAFLEGHARLILQLERTLLNLIGHLSGITTQVAFFVMKAKSVNPEIVIACTRKTTPGMRYFEKMAFKAGGGDTHRFSLSDAVMIKDNHLKLLGGVKEAVKLAKEKTSFVHKIEVEVESLEDAVSAAEAGADIVMLDNMSPMEISRVVERYKELGYYGKVLLEASGGINFENVEDYAKTGVNIISSGYLTKTIRSCDVSLEVEE
jgi:nicotinate-nucleotide pyrophosphorylase (carboxylating)|uniref:nicotinate-nucleotide diphosphorylase (carboxylating) n=1 Tax=candidate division WOR-3 bacterium TaxID=2052148 RepID=A0A7V3KNZ6_UNCW3